MNIQSFTGAIMAIGVAVANAILFVVFAEEHRRKGALPLNPQPTPEDAHATILMTSMAMIAGMIPMALGLGEGSEQTVPLGRAVIGGLSFATATTLLILPLVFSVVQQRASVDSPSLDPDDPQSILVKEENSRRRQINETSACSALDTGSMRNDSSLRLVRRGFLLRAQREPASRCTRYAYCGSR